MIHFRKNPTIDDLKRKTKDESTIRKAVGNHVPRKELTWDNEKKE